MNKKKQTWFDGLKCGEQLIKKGVFYSAVIRSNDSSRSEEFRKGVTDYINYHYNVLRSV